MCIFFKSINRISIELSYRDVGCVDSLVGTVWPVGMMVVDMMAADTMVADTLGADTLVFVDRVVLVDKVADTMAWMTSAL